MWDGGAYKCQWSVVAGEKGTVATCSAVVATAVRRTAMIDYGL